jgi:hypothetical protein
MKFNALTRLERNVHRAGEIIGVLAKYGLADWVNKLNFSWIQDRIRSVDGKHIPDLKIEERVRLAFTQLGTTFIKLGQMLSTRPDVIGLEMARELAHLQTATLPDPPDTVRATIEAEFGKPLKEMFAEFTQAPLASAAILVRKVTHSFMLNTWLDSVRRSIRAAVRWGFLRNEARSLKPKLEVMSVERCLWRFCSRVKNRPTWEDSASA